MLTDFRTDDTCATLHVRHAMTDRNTRALLTRGHALPRVHCADRRITILRAHRSLRYSTRARWIHVGTPAHVCTVHSRSVLNLRARAGRYTTVLVCISSNSRRIQFVCCVASDAARYSASHIESVTMFHFVDFQKVRLPYRACTTPVSDFLLH